MNCPTCNATVSKLLVRKCRPVGGACMNEFVGCLAILFVFPVVIYVLSNVRMMKACKNCGWTEKCSEFEIVRLPWG